MADILVIGSSAINNVIYADRLPSVNEQVIGSVIYRFPDGNGVNQAAAIAKLGKSASVISKVGNDDNGKIIVNNLVNENVNVSGIITVNKPTDIKQTTIDNEGNSATTFVSYKDDEFTDGDLRKANEAIKKAHYVIINTDLKKQNVIDLIFKFFYMGKKIILNPIEPIDYDKKILSMVDYFVPNIKEFSRITGENTNSDAKIIKAAEKLLSMGVKNIIVKKGKDGVIGINKNEIFKVAGRNVKVVDKFGAGDSFIAAFAVAIIEKNSFKDAVYYANMAAAITIQRKGTVPAFPTKEIISKYIKSLSK